MGGILKLLIIKTKKHQYRGALPIFENRKEKNQIILYNEITNKNKEFNQI
jgi:hypothetical protein